ncbi:MAG: hypothetical protein B5M56_10555, partial [Desulfococcus sp. 4484_241]
MPQPQGQPDPFLATRQDLPGNFAFLALHGIKKARRPTMRRGRLADVDNPDVPGDKTRLLFYAVYKILQKLLLECFEH